MMGVMVESRFENAAKSYSEACSPTAQASREGWRRPSPGAFDEDSFTIGGGGWPGSPGSVEAFRLLPTHGGAHHSPKASIDRNRIRWAGRARQDPPNPHCALAIHPMPRYNAAP